LPTPCFQEESVLVLLKLKSKARSGHQISHLRLIGKEIPSSLVTANEFKTRGWCHCLYRTYVSPHMFGPREGRWSQLGWGKPGVEMTFQGCWLSEYLIPMTKQHPWACLCADFTHALSLVGSYEKWGRWKTKRTWKNTGTQGNKEDPEGQKGMQRKH
jgi:hypothetical protein